MYCFTLGFLYFYNYLSMLGIYFSIHYIFLTMKCILEFYFPLIF